MPDRIHSDWISAYMQYSSNSEAPDKFHLWTAVVTIAGALRRRVWIDQAYFQWTPNMYVVFVAPPGIVSKSTTANIGMRLLRQVPDIHFGPDAVTWQALTESLAASTEEVFYPREDVYLPMSCITISSSEFGTFLNPSDREMVDVLVSLWDGQLGTWEKATKTQGSDLIVNPWINLVACTTPAWIAGNFPEYLIGGGFTSRCVFVYAEEKRRLVAYPGLDAPRDMDVLEKSLVHDLECISQLVGEYKLSPEALALGEEWYTAHYEETKSAIDNRALGYRARKQTHIHKLAMVLSASRSDSLIIEREDLERAIGIVTDLEEDMPKVFSLIGRSAGAQWTESVISLVESAGVIDRSALVRNLSTRYSLKEIEEGLLAAVAGGYVRITHQHGYTLYLFQPHLPEHCTQGDCSSQAS